MRARRGKLRLPGYPQRMAALLLDSRDWATEALLQPIAQVENYFEIARMQTRLTQVALSLAAYKADHGDYPPSLPALTPGYLPAIPEDLFSGKSPLYRPERGGYLLYSVGPNGSDDGGAGRRPADDIVASTR